MRGKPAPSRGAPEQLARTRGRAEQAREGTSAWLVLQVLKFPSKVLLENVSPHSSVSPTVV